MIELRCTSATGTTLYVLAVDAVIRAWLAGDRFGAVTLLATVVEPLAEQVPIDPDMATPADLWNHFVEEAVVAA